MKQKDILTLAIVAVITGIISMVLSTIFFSGPKKDSKVPAVDAIPASMPDIKGDSKYSSFLNEEALDPTQPVTISPAGNTKPFNSQ